MEIPWIFSGFSQDFRWTVIFHGKLRSKDLFTKFEMFGM